MNHKLLTFVGVLTCLGVGLTTADQPILGPWQSLNPPVENPAPYVVSEPQEFHQESSGSTVTEPLDDTDLTPEEEFLISNIPFKLPFKLHKKQLAVAMKLLKEAVKPIVKSKTLRVTLAYFDDLLSSYNSDQESQMYMKFFLDSLQDMYEGKEAVQFNKMLKGIFTDISDEETARTLDDMWQSTLDYVYDPMRIFVMRPMRSLVLEPLSNAVSDLANRVGFWDASTPGMDYPRSFERWSDAMTLFARRMSTWSSQARGGVEYAARVLEVQDEGRSCDGGCDSLTEGGHSDLSVEVLDVSWLVWLAGGVVLFSIVATSMAIATIPMVAGFSLGIAGDDDFDHLTSYPSHIPSLASPPAIAGGPALRPVHASKHKVGGPAAFGTAHAVNPGLGALPPKRPAGHIKRPYRKSPGGGFSYDEHSHLVDRSSHEESKHNLKISNNDPHHQDFVREYQSSSSDQRKKVEPFSTA